MAREEGRQGRDAEDTLSHSAASGLKMAVTFAGNSTAIQEMFKRCLSQTGETGKGDGFAEKTAMARAGECCVLKTSSAVL